MGRSASSDPLEKFRFLVSFTIPTGDSTHIDAGLAGFHDVQMPKRSTNKIAYREGHNSDISSQSAGLSTFEDIVMSRGILAGGINAGDLYKWMSIVHIPTSDGLPAFNLASTGSTGTAQGLNTYRTEVVIKMLDRSGAAVRAWKLVQAWPVHFTPGSDLNAAEDGDKSIEAITLCYEDFYEVAVNDFSKAVAKAAEAPLTTGTAPVAPKS